MDAFGSRVRRQELYGADAVAPDFGEEVERGRGRRPEAGLHAPAYLRAVRQQVVEKRFDPRIAVGRIRRLQRHRKRQRARAGRLQPALRVTEFMPALRGNVPVPHEFAVHPNIQPPGFRWASHVLPLRRPRCRGARRFGPEYQFQIERRKQLEQAFHTAALR